jgi:type I restriction enzyme S subunit
MKASKIQLKNGFVPYPEYKDSGIEWIGKIPKEWQTYRAKTLFKKMNRTPKESDEIITAFRDGAVTLRKNRREDGFTMADKEIGYQRINVVDLVIHGMDAFAGAIGVSDSTGKASPVYSVCTPISDVDTKFYSYLLRHMSKSNYIFALAKGIRERSTEFRFKEFGNLLVSKPPLETQKRIAEYLDEKTDLIDQIIERKKRLIELLREKRTAVINQAVTKGLDPNVELVDSGIEWIGKIPKGWEKQRLGYEAIISVGNKDVNEGNPDGEYPFFTCSKERTFSDNYSFDLEALLIAGNGEVGLTQYYKGKFEAYQRTYVLCGFKNNPHYFRYYIASLLPVALLNQSIGSVISYIKKGDLTHFPILIPIIREQKDVVDFLDNKIQSLDTLFKKAEKSIEKLQEFKASLISNVVTGKIVV